jgi:hypothetical protein
MRRQLLRQALNSTLSGLVLLGAVVVSAADKLPEVSHDGLKLQHDTELAVVYKRDGADLKQYDKIALLEAYVAFRKNWQRDYNRDADLEHRVRDRDIKRIRENLAKEFNRVFTEVLSEKGGHAMVSEGAPGVLIIRPAIINLDVTAPDVTAPGMDRSYSASAGQMTLYMELFDGATGEIIYRVVDPRAAGDEFWQVRNEATNRADADRVLRRWAELLNSHLAGIKG